MRHTAFAGFCALGLVLTGCDELDGLHPCTEIGCSDSIGVTIDGSAHDWADGNYTLDLGFDTQQYRCTFSLPQLRTATSPGASPTPFDCAPQLPAGNTSLVLTPAAVCPLAVDGGTESPPGAQRGCHYSIQLDTDAAPAAVTVRLALGDTVLVEETRRPEYAVSMPNGPECTPTCRQAAIELEVAAP